MRHSVSACLSLCILAAPVAAASAPIFEVRMSGYGDRSVGVWGNFAAFDKNYDSLINNNEIISVENISFGQPSYGGPYGWMAHDVSINIYNLPIMASEFGENQGRVSGYIWSGCIWPSPPDCEPWERCMSYGLEGVPLQWTQVGTIPLPAGAALLPMGLFAIAAVARRHSSRRS